MYQKGYGIINTLAPVHVGATAGEERGNLNLIFRDQFTKTGIIPGSSIRGRLRSEMRQDEYQKYKQSEKKEEAEARTLAEVKVNKWYGNDANSSDSERTSESLVKFEYASIVWLPVFCPGQPIVWVSCPRLLKRYKRITQSKEPIPSKYTRSSNLVPLPGNKLFFNFGFLTIENHQNLSPWFPDGQELPAVVIGDDEIGMIHDMALYRQSRVALEKDQKRVADKAFFNVEALPEETILVFPVALKPDEAGEKWQPFPNAEKVNDIYLGGLESVGFGHCEIKFFILNNSQLTKV
ncbi:RAMP superfamily CRISPR-associated protein [Anabaena azotica]|uniref:Type III-B CRISPR module RAMP protein Cmr4 n=1 Tax=Anabaena azotica FACHB-119 TaxID=947527 RepID=A0ABR8D465_9NOST|nr:RAMP superfamily CRISPR-associated protein [Anabaena azotica]MBD2501985.1 type III-B CRISPR module RAMP protein Cmr4 [Anabaena azotica FACHB-119]